jgi:uncharacterized protein
MKALAHKIKRTLWVSPFCLAIFLSPLKSQAITIPEVPNPRQVNGTWVTDMAGILDAPTEAKLNSIISQLERQNGTEIAVVTVPETAPSASPKEFATTLFNYWGIGKKGKNNGVLFLISKGDRRVEIETGYGIQAILPNAQVGNIIDTQILPRFKQGDFKGGTLAGTKALIVALDASPSSSASKSPATTRMPSPTPEKSLVTQPSSLSEEQTQTDVPWLLPVGGSGLVLVLIGIAVSRSRRVFVKPEGRTRVNGSNRPIYCADCKKRMEKVEVSTIESNLTQPEKVAQRIGSVKFERWKCPTCSQQLTGSGFHLIAWVLNPDRFSECPTCQELTVTRTQKTLKQPTQYSSGRRLITDSCLCCSYRKEKEEKIPRLPPPPPPSSGGGYSGGFSTGGCSTGGGGSSGGGGFGGGSSGGGGAGGSF